MFKDYIKNEINKSIEVKRNIISKEVLLSKISKIAEVCLKTYNNNNKIIIAGNGGSAADAQHIAGELVSKFYFDRPALNAIAITTDTSILTAISNDYGYDQLFARQIQAIGSQGDVFIGITTSGNSKNIIEAFKIAKKIGLITICFNGKDGGIIELESLSDYNLIVPSHSTPRIQESHITIGHIMCAIIEKELFSNES